ncbi:MAG: ABC transporter permease [Anaerolineales bacterium]|nr:ABC transporter permease [Anaerolineales bacterium]MCS7249041.1 ABC transporter permease [Anaerolineales bacterium]MDW8162854.1 ABC transporter permease [Anaerolineales bacterium]MDW8446642.1 ABC transporter permease [Anaerolineales bacterium]
MKVLRYLIRKLLRLVLLLFTISVLSFTLVSLSPIDPVQAYVGAEMMRIGPEQRQRIAERWGLNDPPVVRYMRWLSSLMRGDLGTSAIYNQPVSQVIRQRFLTSLGLMGTAWVLSGVLGFLLGVLSGARAGSWIDQVIRFYAYLLASTPAFWLALLLLIVFAVFLKWAPVCCATPPGLLPEQVTFAQRLHHLALPALTLSIIGIANITLHTRQKLITILNSDYILFARAQGENLFGLIWHHGLRNIALPAITLQFASISELFGGSVLAEQVFAYPGLGQATVQAGLRGDVPLLLGIVLFSTLFVFTGNTIADILYHLIDPRIRLGVES